MTRLAPTAWWRGLAGLTRSGSAVEGLSWTVHLGEEAELATAIEPAIVPPGEAP